jgi:thiamine-monophosphate kinase
MAERSSRTAAEMGEFPLIRAITARFPQGPHVRVGPGDDAAVVEMPSGSVVASVDMLVQDRHFRLDWSSASDIGHKAAAEALSDINAMGGVATALLVGLGCPEDLETRWILELADGLAEEAAVVGASVVGGDLSAASVITLSVTVIGVCEHAVVRRSGARVGDIVAISGRQGWAAAGFAVLARGFRSPRVVVDAHRRPSPPYLAGAEAARLGATAMIDVSDGLLQDIAHLAAASGVAVDVDGFVLEVPDALQTVAAAMGVDPLRFVLTGGDDYSLVATFPPDIELPDTWCPIGRVLERGEGSGEEGLVTVNRAAYPDAAGHQHFG